MEYYCDCNANTIEILLLKSDLNIHNAFIHFDDTWDFYIITGYKHAINAIINYYEENQGTLVSMNISILYPLAYLHRHEIELELKYIYKLLRFINNENWEISGHKLIDIWNDCKDLLFSYFDKKRIIYDCKINYIENILQQLSTIDPEGMAFRYSRRKNTKNAKTLILPYSRDEEYYAFDIMHFHKVILKLENRLKEIEDYLIADYAEKVSII
jgi:hypothetical protein